MPFPGKGESVRPVFGAGGSVTLPNYRMAPVCETGLADRDGRPT